MTFLITKWFGCFLIDEQMEIKKYILFSKNDNSILNNMEKINKGEILDEEMELALLNTNLIISQKRLQPLGAYKPNHPVFQNNKIIPSDYGYSSLLLRSISKKLAQESIEENLKIPDFQIIQMIHAVDDLIQTSNLLMERITAWKIFPVQTKTVSPFEDLQKHVNLEIQRLQEIIKIQIGELAPNTSALVGPLIAARLLAQAGSMEKLAMFPASSIQLLGAEKALFRFKKEGGKPPKHGVIFQHSSISKASKKNRGKIARILAMKISLAIKADVFTKRNLVNELLTDYKEKTMNLNK